MSDIMLSNTLVLIDTYVRSIADQITYDTISKHATVITDIRELNNGYYGADLVFFEPSVPSVVTPSTLTELCTTYNVKPYFIYANESVLSLFSECPNFTSVQASYLRVEWNLIYAVLNKDSAILENYKVDNPSPIALASLFKGLPEPFVEPINKLYTAYLNAGNSIRRLAEDKSRLEEIVSVHRSNGIRSAKIINEWRVLYEEVVAENRIQSSLLSENFDVTFSGVFMERPRVLYIKTVSHLAGIDTLLMTLYSVIIKQYKMSCKVLKLVDSSSALQLRYTPSSYHFLHTTYNTHDVLVNDLLVSLGAYNFLLGQLMLNRSGLDVLIVHDMRGTLNPAIAESLIDLHLTEMTSDFAVLSEFENCLSDFSKADFVWDNKELAKLTGSAASRISNHPTIISILDRLL